jgi:epsilon-lactone hydrolase
MSIIEPDGTLHIDAFDLPPSAGWSDEARTVFLKRFSGPPVSVQSINVKLDEESWLASSMAFRSSMENLHRRLLNRIEESHPCDVDEETIAGVRVQWVTPRSGVTPRNAGRVLVNLHGGAFVGGSEYCGLVESLPVADVGGYRICVVDYRQGWEHRFPAASEDVASVVTALEEQSDPAAIGIFGYSAGGALTAQSVAWFLAHDIPLPGAVAMCSAGAGASGDSAYLSNRAMGATSASGDDRSMTSGRRSVPARFGYAAGVDPALPLLAPVHAPDILARFHRQWCSPVPDPSTRVMPS